jgi:hypothetical protein
MKTFFVTAFALSCITVILAFGSFTFSVYSDRICKQLIDSVTHPLDECIVSASGPNDRFRVSSCSGPWATLNGWKDTQTCFGTPTDTSSISVGMCQALPSVGQLVQSFKVVCLVSSGSSNAVGALRFTVAVTILSMCLWS